MSSPANDQRKDHDEEGGGKGQIDLSWEFEKGRGTKRGREKACEKPGSDLKGRKKDRAREEARGGGGGGGGKRGGGGGGGGGGVGWGVGLCLVEKRGICKGGEKRVVEYNQSSGKEGKTSTPTVDDAGYGKKNTGRKKK